MAKKSILSVETRAGVGKGAARQTRREGFVPGIIYGGGEDPLPIRVKGSELLRRLMQGGFLTTLHTLTFEGSSKKETVVCRGVERHLLNGLPTHIDFLRMHAGETINIAIPVEFINQEQSVGLKKGGNLVIVRPEVELYVPVDNIPEHITIDLKSVEIGDVIHISNVKLPKNCKPVIDDRDFVIANISAPTVDLSADTTE